MGDTKKTLDNLTCTPINKEAHISDQLKCCHVYFYHIENDISLAANKQFYDNLQVLISILHKLPSELEWYTREIIQNISISLIRTLATCSLPLDSQMMCSTAFCSALHTSLSTHETETLYQSCLNTDGYIFLCFDGSSLQICIRNVEVFQICLCHGILQSSKPSDVLYKEPVDSSTLIYVMLNILEEACMKYSRLTSIAFKVMVSWMRKVCLELKISVPVGISRRIFSIVNSNWESPISGVKEQNTKIFELFLDVCSANRMDWYNNGTTFQSITSVLCHTMEEQPWKMKSKYYMLSILLPRYGVRKAFADFPDLAPGLVSSLSYSHMASAGSYVYKSCLKNMDADDWINVFKVLIVQILTGKDVISIQKKNVLSYWIPSTLKTFPQLLNLLLDQIMNTSLSSGLETAIFSVVSLLKLGQKSGMIFNMWDGHFSVDSFTYLDFLNLMNSALQHSIEAVRAEAFAVVCMSSKTSNVPSLKEFELVKTFLLENVNTDSASLRQAILNAFTLFLTRLCDSSVRELKLEESTQNPKQCVMNMKGIVSNSEGSKEINVTGILQNIHFLNWLHHFLIHNLEPGANYQRKVLSLQLYKLVLSYFSEPSEGTKESSRLRRKELTLEGDKVMKYALKLGKWPFNSESSHKTLLSCVLDSTDDIRETAGSILMEYFGFKEPDTEENKHLLEYALQLCTSPLFYETESGALLMKVLGNWTYKMPQEKSIELFCSMTSMKCNKNLARDRNRSYNSVLCNQQKLLDGLQCNPNRPVHNNMESKDSIKVNIKKKVGTWENLYVMHPSLCKEKYNVELPEETKIFEGQLAVISRDGMVGQATTSFVADKSHCSSDKQMCSGVGSSNSMVNSNNRKSPSYNVKKRSETTCYWREESHTGLQDGVESSFGEYWASSLQYQHPAPRPDSSVGQGDNFLLKDHNKVWHKLESEVASPFYNEHLQNILERQVELGRCDKQEAYCLSYNHTPQGPLISQRKKRYSRKRTKFRNLGKNKHPEMTALLPTIKIQPSYSSESSVITETHFSPWSTKSQGRNHDVGTGCGQISTSGYQNPSKNNLEKLESKNVSQTYNGSAPLSIFILTQAEAQLTSLKGDLFQAASSGSPLHGTLTALIRLVTQSDGSEFGCMSAEEVDRTVTLLEQTVSFFLDLLATKAASTADVAPSFAEMDEAIRSSIQQTEFMSEDEGEMHLSPAHQLVSNCVWLNLKACCTLASGLACSTDCSYTVLNRCGRLITQVLTRCRHKGAIESAGVALSMFVKSITTADYKYTSDKDVELMLGQLLTEFLDSVMCGGSKASVTRRSAGLSILIHRIVAYDMQTGKPLLHMCMSQLLEIARAPPLITGISSKQGSLVVDLPQAQAMHFLRILVQDSSLRQDMAQYMSSVTILCFSNFSSPVWTIRNAALQLSGALIPKLVGQKKIQDEELTLGSSVSVEEFFSHFPDLTNFMLVSLQKAANCHPSQALQQHADLIPMLSLLAKVAVGIEVFISGSLVETIVHYRVCFVQLLSSPVYHVRKLAAKAYERFVPFSSTFEVIMTIVGTLKMHNTDCDGTHSICLGYRENHLNGILLTLKYLVEKLNHDSENVSKLESKRPEIITVLKEAFNNCMIWDSCTYFNRVLLLELIGDNSNAVEIAYLSTDETFEKILDVHKTLEKENLRNTYKPGLFMWAAKVIGIVVKKCFPHHLVSVWYNSYTLYSHCPDIVSSSFTSLKWRLLHDEKVDVAIKASLFIALLKVCLEVPEDCHVLFPLLDVMLVLIQDTKVNVVITFRELQKVSVWALSDSKNKSEYSKIALPVVAGLLSQCFVHGHYIKLSTQTPEFVLKLTLCIKDRSDVMKYEEDFRLNAARALHLLVPSLQGMLAERFKEFCTDEVLKQIIEILLDAEFTFLQDEDHDVRKEAAKFVPAYTAKIKKTSTSLMMNPYSSLRKLVEPNLLLTLLTVSQAMEFLWKKLCYMYELKNVEQKHYHHYHEYGNISSPFAHGTNNIYCEKTKMIDVFGKSLLEIIQIANTSERNGLIELISCRLVNFKNDVGTVLSLLKRTESCGISSASDNETCYVVAKKLIYLSKVMAALGIEGNCDMESVMVELQQFFTFCTN